MSLHETGPVHLEVDADGRVTFKPGSSGKEKPPEPLSGIDDFFKRIETLLFIDPATLSIEELARQWRAASEEPFPLDEVKRKVAALAAAAEMSQCSKAPKSPVPESKKPPVSLAARRWAELKRAHRRRR